MNETAMQKQVKTICDGESVAIYLDIIWLENQQIYTNPVRLESV